MPAGRAIAELFGDVELRLHQHYLLTSGRCHLRARLGANPIHPRRSVACAHRPLFWPYSIAAMMVSRSLSRKTSSVYGRSCDREPQHRRLVTLARHGQPGRRGSRSPGFSRSCCVPGCESVSVGGHPPLLKSGVIGPDHREQLTDRSNHQMAALGSDHVRDTASRGFLTLDRHLAAPSACLFRLITSIQFVIKGVALPGSTRRFSCRMLCGPRNLPVIRRSDIAIGDEGRRRIQRG